VSASGSVKGFSFAESQNGPSGFSSVSGSRDIVLNQPASKGAVPGASSASTSAISGKSCAFSTVAGCTDRLALGGEGPNQLSLGRLPGTLSSSMFGAAIGKQRNLQGLETNLGGGDTGFQELHGLQFSVTGVSSADRTRLSSLRQMFRRRFSGSNGMGLERRLRDLSDDDKALLKQKLGGITSSTGLSARIHPKSYRSTNRYLGGFSDR
jgi:hypothetical protein